MKSRRNKLSKRNDLDHDYNCDVYIFFFSPPGVPGVGLSILSYASFSREFIFWCKRLCFIEEKRRNKL